MATLSAATWQGGNLGWTLALHLQADGLQSKAGEYDESVTMQMRFLNQYVGSKLYEMKKQGVLDSLWVIPKSGKLKTLSAGFTAAAAILKLPQLAVLHQLRHSGPACGSGSRQETSPRSKASRPVGLRQKWYEQAGLVDLQLASLDPEVFMYCEEALPEVPRSMLDNLIPSLPRWAAALGPRHLSGNEHYEELHWPRSQSLANRSQQRPAD